MAEFEVWDSEEYNTADCPHDVQAGDAEAAAEVYAQRMWDRDPYGDPDELFCTGPVFVRDSDGVVSCFEVRGELSVSFYAHALRASGNVHKVVDDL